MVRCWWLAGLLVGRWHRRSLLFRGGWRGGGAGTDRRRGRPFGGVGGGREGSPPPPSVPGELRRGRRLLGGWKELGWQGIVWRVQRNSKKRARRAQGERNETARRMQETLL